MRFFTKLRTSHLFVAAALVVSACTPTLQIGTGENNPLRFTSSKLVLAENRAVTSTTRKGLKEMRNSNSNFYGAMYTSLDGSYYTWYTGNPSLELAQYLAKSECEFRKRGAGPCVPHAIILPLDGTGKTSKLLGVSSNTRLHMEDVLSGTRAGRFGAVVQNGLGVVTSSINKSSMSAAESEATKSCRAVAEDYKRTHPPALYKIWQGKINMGCKVVMRHKG